MKKILVAGIGNIFHGDDAFGCEVVSRSEQCTWPQNVTVRDFGIRSYDLAYALNGDFDVVILVDAAPCGKEPGTLYLIEPDTKQIEESECAQVDAHSMNPVAAIQMAQSLGGIQAKLYVIGCEPAVLENDLGEIGLSLEVEEAIPQALAMIESLIADLVVENEDQTAGVIPA
jgi:hydrogenase maturation protease